MKQRAGDILLGFEVGSGQPVTIPVRHMAVTGQTQEAGKTTALEALITRSELRAVTFVTKRGEGSFSTARRIDPYFREQADWQFVASILEASRGEKLKFERAWIIRASKGARTLADVRRNVQHAMLSAKGMSADVYLTLDAYLEAVVPAIAKVRWAPRLELNAGVNAIDLTSVPTEMQHLVIKSSLDWVLEREQDTIVVIPEAWKFIPQGRGTPVKLSALALMRQGAALRNYVWVDSQDIGGVDKETLRQVPVWLLGVQRETNEIKRTLDNIPASVAKPSKADIATLELGQFIACWGRHTVKTYVQPAWMNADLARKTATGELDVHNASAIASGGNVLRAFRNVFQSAPPTEEEPVNAAEAQALKDKNAQLTRENEELRRRLERLEHSARADRAHHDEARTSRGASERSRDDSGIRQPATPARTPAAAARTFSAEETFDNEALYQAIKARLIDELPKDPRVMEIVLARPELRIKVERHVLQIDGRSLRGRIARLIADDFFTQARTSANVLDELLKRGADRPSNIELGNEMKALCDMGFFTKDNKWYSLVDGMKVSIVDTAA